MARGDTHSNAGVLLMTKETQESGDVIRALTIVELYVFSLTISDGYPARLWCAFTTESMAVAYANSETLTPKVWKSLLYEFGNIKNAARGRFYVVPKLRNQPMPRLFISLLSLSAGSGCKWIQSLEIATNTVRGVVTCM